MESVTNNRINVDLSLNIEYSVEEVSSNNGSSEIIVGRNIIDEVEEIGISEKENIVISSQNIEINGFLQESDEVDTFKESNIVPFIGQIFLSEEEAFFYKRYAYQHGFSVRKVPSTSPVNSVSTNLPEGIWPKTRCLLFGSLQSFKESPVTVEARAERICMFTP
ncbi:hypothetical protein KIW84_064538 [Lathyrus oleraceus]|uniref:FAR1 domain-containing protein n=1 Tax=Pisum sativum TaxID=3888 RepID=A0A9D4WCG6_PEA|nr:hypothetical protein KIW84_064538 [Pisum sativum]